MPSNLPNPKIGKCSFKAKFSTIFDFTIVINSRKYYINYNVPIKNDTIIIY